MCLFLTPTMDDSTCLSIKKNTVSCLCISYTPPPASLFPPALPQVCWCQRTRGTSSTPQSLQDPEALLVFGLFCFKINLHRWWHCRCLWYKVKQPSCAGGKRSDWGLRPSAGTRDRWGIDLCRAIFQANTWHVLIQYIIFLRIVNVNVIWMK